MDTSLPDLLARMARTHILVIGDIILDRFVYGEVTRISPESPVPVLAATRHETMLGGAGNVLANLQGLGVQEASLIGLIGADQTGQDVQQRAGPTSRLIQADDRPTIIKTRFIAGHQQMLRVDEEKLLPLKPDLEIALLAAVEEMVPGQDAVILSDYGKGVLSDRIIERTIDLAKKFAIPVLVDPKGRDYSRYRGASVVTPNRKELAEVTGGLAVESDADIIAAGQALLQASGIEALVATRSQDGMTVFEPGREPLHLRAQALEVFDVSGAGDTVIATLAAALGAGSTLADAARLANRAGGIVVAKVGTASIRAEELVHHTDGRANSLMSEQAACDAVRRWKTQGLKVGFTNGCFDILHAGHVNYLAETRRHCDRLIVGLNHDRSVRLLKGETRPVNDQHARAAVIAALAAVDGVVLFGAEEAGQDNTPCALIQSLQPDVYFKGGDYKLADLAEAKIVASYGGETRLMALTEGKSTTEIISKITNL